MHVGACKTFFRSLKDDKSRQSKGVLATHRIDLKEIKRLKQVHVTYSILVSHLACTITEFSTFRS